MKVKAKGFTLIELIVVIVILGILAATALPKFIDVSADARSAVLDGIQGSAASAATMAFGKATMQNKASGSQAISVGTTTINLTDGYPTAASICDLMQDNGGATCSNGVWTLKTNCTLTYTHGTPPTYSKTTSGC